MRLHSQSHLLYWKLYNKFNTLLMFGVFLLVVSLEVNESHFLVKTLPGFPGDLPFILETGYIGVGESDDLQLFYYFVESEGNPDNDPLMIWFPGGPGCSGLSAILYEIGPFTMNYTDSTLEKQMLQINPYSWTKVANIIFIDQPVGTGFSYARTHQAYKTNDTLASTHAYQFIKKWFMDHPKFLKNPFYVAGDSYGGIVVPMIVQEIYKGNEVGEGPQININGYVLGNPVTDIHDESNKKIPFAHRMALLSDAIYKSVKENCHGEYVKVDLDNILCINDLQVVDKCLGRIFEHNILEPSCYTANTKKHDLLRRGLTPLDNTSVHISSLPQLQKQGCRDDNYLYAAPWANSIAVREALHIREESNETKWAYCKEIISYMKNVINSVAYHQQLSHKEIRALVYSGDHDVVVSYMSTMNWIESLNLLVMNDWGPWFVNKQVAGYTIKYSRQQYNLTFATVKGGGHTAPEYKPKECLSMITRWLVNEAL